MEINLCVNNIIKHNVFISDNGESLNDRRFGGISGNVPVVSVVMSVIIFFISLINIFLLYIFLKKGVYNNIIDVMVKRCMDRCMDERSEEIKYFDLNHVLT